jgi:hypothetical protein
MRTKPFIVEWRHSSDLVKSLYINGNNWIASVGEDENVPEDEAVDFMNEIYRRKGGGSIHILVEALLEKGFDPIRLTNLAYACGRTMFDQTPDQASPLILPAFTHGDSKSEGIARMQKVVANHEGEDVGGVASIVALGCIAAFMDKYKGRNGDVSMERAISILKDTMKKKCSDCPSREKCKTTKNKIKKLLSNEPDEDEFIKAEKFNSHDPRFN